MVVAMPEVERSDLRGEPDRNPGVDVPDLNHEEWGSGDVVISDEDGSWIQAPKSVCVSESEWR